MARKQTAIALQGGAALGAYQCGVLKALYELEQVNPQIMTGISIGILNAAVFLGGKHTPNQSLGKLWEAIAYKGLSFFPSTAQKNTALLGHPLVYTPHPMLMFAPMLAPSLFDMTPLYNFLHQVIDFNKLNASPTRLVIAMTDVEKGELVYVDNHSDGGIRAEHIVAGMSLPPFFSAKHVDGRTLWDGGTLSNVLLMPVLDFFGQSPVYEEDEYELIAITMFRQRTSAPRTLKAVQQRKKDFVFNNTILHEQRHFQMVNEYTALLKKVAQELPWDSPLRQEELFRRSLDYPVISNYRVFNYEQESMEEFTNMADSVINKRIEVGYKAVRDSQSR